MKLNEAIGHTKRRKTEVKPLISYFLPIMRCLTKTQKKILNINYIVIILLNQKVDVLYVVNKMITQIAYIKICTSRRAKQRSTPERKAKGREYARKLREKQGETYRIQRRKYFLKQKLDVIEKLGGVCVMCDINNPIVLTIHHKSGDGGGRYRKILGMTLYRGILNGSISTEDIELRCFNCNILNEYESGRHYKGLHIDYVKPKERNEALQ